MDVFDAISQRRSVRTFKPDKIDPMLIEKLIQTGRMAPTAHNLQPWQFVVVTDASIRRGIALLTDYGKFIAEAPVCIAVFSKTTKYYIEDCSAATQNILLAGTSMGLGTCWVAGDKKPYCSRIAQLLEVPPKYKLVSLIAVGYPVGEPTIPLKLPLKEIYHKEKFSL